MKSQSASVVAAATGSHVKTEDVVEFKTGGYEDLDENGIEITDKTYPKYAVVNAKGKGEIQVRALSIQAAIVDQSFSRL
jgi:hypothetical protein